MRCCVKEHAIGIMASLLNISNEVPEGALAKPSPSSQTLLLANARALSQQTLSSFGPPPPQHTTCWYTYFWLDIAPVTRRTVLKEGMIGVQRP